MEKTDKSAEEIMNEWAEIPKSGYYPSWIIHAMHDYAAQQLSEYKEVIKELLPIAMAYPISTQKPLWKTKYIELMKVIDRAKKLIEK